MHFIFRQSSIKTTKWNIRTCSFLSFCFKVLCASDLGIFHIFTSNIFVFSIRPYFADISLFIGGKGIHLRGWMNNYRSSIGDLSGLSIIESAPSSSPLKYLSYWLSMVLNFKQKYTIRCCIWVTISGNFSQSRISTSCSKFTFDYIWPRLVEWLL